MKKTFYSNGKLLITGEYLVLDGANAFALPTKLGQNLIIEDGEKQKINWKSQDADGSIWFEDTILFSEITDYIPNETETVRNTLITILYQAYLKNNNFLTKDKGYNITTQLTFARKWGLGTSSTLINNIAQWLDIDAFELLNTSFGGSGYDIACAKNNGPIIYHLEEGKPIIEKTTFNPEFTNQIYFVYLNKKQSSKTAIANYNSNKHHNLDRNIAKNNQITLEVLEATSVENFRTAIEKHEARMSLILENNTVKELLFSDFKGSIKSLGAWGGDFIMVVSNENPSTYFNAKGYETIFTFEELILNSKS
ncbi:GYDIA family GHMP kinase [Flavobacterium sp. NG2]|uniref:GYDIA family GHMP kinase n=1 Tax=Flavobacterium sp. NG2 TaxID=3097547 RepID=UPI002A82A2AF|nr:GYDIA family GHMP kinase [Flavobacterium sp. NG2]WPR72548.1 GYDIA family GHMP kinase [Flavobacterium sp. NG2]